MLPSPFSLPPQLKQIADVTVTGTFRWMAPEIMKDEPVGFKSDIYSYGMVIWELVTRQLPFGDAEWGQIVYAVCEHNARPPIPSSFPPPLADMVRACWKT